jgi:hypothetical protein
VREEEYIRGLLAGEATGLFVAESGGQLVGVVCIVAREAPPVPLFVPRRYAVLDNLVVQEALRRRGSGGRCWRGPTPGPWPRGWSGWS